MGTFSSLSPPYFFEVVKWHEIYYFSSISIAFHRSKTRISNIQIYDMVLVIDGCALSVTLMCNKCFIKAENVFSIFLLSPGLAYYKVKDIFLIFRALLRASGLQLGWCRWFFYLLFYFLSISSNIVFNVYLLLSKYVPIPRSRPWSECSVDTTKLIYSKRNLYFQSHAIVNG